MEVVDTLKSLVAAKPYFSQKNSPQVLLYQGDCLELLEDTAENSVDVIFADPPYNLSNGGTTVHAGKRVSVNKGQWDKSRGVEADFEFHSAWIKACQRVLKETGTIWISGTYHSIYQCGFALQRHGFHLLNEISWYKPNAAPNLACRMFAASHETVLWARKHKKAKHYFDYELMKLGDWSDDAMKNPGKQMRSVWSISTPGKREKEFGKHPTQKPLRLLERIILASTPPDAVVLDPFAGSSTTGVAAISNGRNFIGFEIEQEFLDLSVQRFKALK